MEATDTGLVLVFFKYKKIGPAANFSA
jgi:hypothetical protein